MRLHKPPRNDRRAAVLLCGAVLVVCCASSRQLLDLTDLSYAKCWLSKPASGIVVSAAKQPLYESGCTGYHVRSIRKHVAVVAVKIENRGLQPVSLDRSHAAFLDGSGNPLEVIDKPSAVAKLLGGGKDLENDFTVYGFQEATLMPGATLAFLVALKVEGDPYFASYFLRFMADDRTVITDSRF